MYLGFLLSLANAVVSNINTNNQNNNNNNNNNK